MRSIRVGVEARIGQRKTRHSGRVFYCVWCRALFGLMFAERVEQLLILWVNYLWEISPVQRDIAISGKWTPETGEILKYRVVPKMAR